MQMFVEKCSITSQCLTSSMLHGSRWQYNASRLFFDFWEGNIRYENWKL